MTLAAFYPICASYSYHEVAREYEAHLYLLMKNLKKLPLISYTQCDGDILHNFI
jgi:hypothetical protein